MTKQKGICEACGVEYEYEYNPKYPRKYCPACSLKKKQEYEAMQGPKDEKPEVVRMFDEKTINKATKNSTTMYVSYAKDIFCALIERHGVADGDKEWMVKAINLVKQAKEAFE